jgi:hypothetical protein
MALVTKYYIKHINSGDIYLGEQWDGDDNWYEALEKPSSFPLIEKLSTKGKFQPLSNTFKSCCSLILWMVFLRDYDILYSKILTHSFKPYIQKCVHSQTCTVTNMHSHLQQKSMEISYTSLLIHLTNFS